MKNYKYTITDAINIITGNDYDEEYIWPNLGEEIDLYNAWRCLLELYGNSEYDKQTQLFTRELPETVDGEQLLEACKVFDAGTNEAWIWRGDDLDYDKEELEYYWGWDNERGETLEKYLEGKTDGHE